MNTNANSTHTLVSPTPTTLEGYLLEFEWSMSVSFVSEYSRENHNIILHPFFEDFVISNQLNEYLKTFEYQGSRPFFGL